MVSRAGCAPQIVHGDTVFTPHAVMHTAFVALQVRIRVRVTSRRHAHGLRRATGAHVKGLKRTHSLTRDLPIHLATHLLTYYVHLLTYPRLLTYHVHLRTYPRLLTKPLTHELSYRAAADRKAPAGPTYYLLLTTYYLLLTTYYLLLTTCSRSEGARGRHASCRAPTAARQACNRMWRRLQLHVLEAVAVLGRGCDRM
jgi:hypothetical protein